MTIIDLAGRAYSRLSVLERTDFRVFPSGGKEMQWRCRCECGGEIVVMGKNLRTGATQSCGCLQKERTAAATLGNPQCRKHSETHGRYKTPEYHAWQSMHQRCSNPKVKGYKDYGGRGITICERWRTFETFYADMGARPSAKHSIDRIDNDGNYEPGNCRWATDSEQGLNTSRNLIVSAFGRTGPLASFVSADTLEYKRAQWRIKRGWNAERALTEPSQRRAA